MSTLGIVAGFVFVENLVLTRFLGLCPFVAASGSGDRAVAMGSGLLFVGSLSCIATWAVRRLVLAPLGLLWLQTVAFMLLVAAAARLMEELARATSPALYAVLLPHRELTMTSSVVLGVCLIAAERGYGVMDSFAAALAGVGGFVLSAGIMASIRAKLDLEWVPRPLRGAPIALITAALLALAFLAFDGTGPTVLRR
jgi:Na+-translocating ferredoxin:NAD+ oxidoreductase subunit A